MLNVCDLTQRHRVSIGGSDEHAGERLRIGAVLRCIPHAHGKALSAFDRHRERRLADGVLNHLLNITDADSVESNLNVGGNVLESNGAWLIVRGVGLIQSVDDVKHIVVGASNGVPVYVEQVADVQLGNAFRVEAR